MGARALYNTLRLELVSFARAFAFVFVVSQSLLKKTFQTRQNTIRIIAVQNINTTDLQRFVYSQERCKIYKDHNINCSCCCVCCATMRLLLNVFHVNLQRFNIIATFIDFSFHALPLIFTGYRFIFVPLYFRLYLRFWLVLNSPKQCCCKKR